MDLDDPLPGPSREIPTSTTSGGARRRTTRSKKRRSTTMADAVATEGRRSRMPKTSKRSRFVPDSDDDEDDDETGAPVDRRGSGGAVYPQSKRSSKRNKSKSRLRSSSSRGGGGGSTSVKGIRKTLRAAILDEDKEKLKKNVRELETARLKLEDKLEARRMRLMAADAKIDKVESDLVASRNRVRELEADNAKLARDKKSTKIRHVKELDKMKKRIAELAAEKGRKVTAGDPVPSTSASHPVAAAAATTNATGDSAGLFQDMLTNFKEFVDNHLSCIVCSEILVFPSTVVTCGHTFCSLCIEKWNKKSADCPICRSKIDDIIPNVGLESYMDKVVETFFPEDAKSARKTLQEERAAQKEEAKRERQRSRESSPSARRRNLLEGFEGLSDFSASLSDDDDYSYVDNGALVRFPTPIRRRYRLDSPPSPISSSASSSSSSSSSSSESSSSSDSHSVQAEEDRYATGNSSSWDEEVNEDQYHDADRHDDEDDGGGGGGGGGDGGQGEDALYAQWLQNFREERDSDPDWANWSDDDDFLLGRNYF